MQEATLEQPIHHDDHGHDHHEPGFIGKYVFSMDHKIIAKQFLITGIVWAIVGAALSILFRVQLGFPEADLAFLKPLLGKWIGENGAIVPEFYNAMITMHGTILVFFVLTAGLSGTFSNFLIPLQVGARDMASPFMNMLSYWFFFMASIVMLASFFLSTGPASGGWTMYPPLSGTPEIGMGAKAGTDLWITSMALFIVSLTLGALNYITTIINMRARGMNMWRMPLTIWAFLVTAIIGVLAFPPLFGAAILLFFDRAFETSFFLNDVMVGGELLLHTGGSPILYQHLFWFLGHPEVYIIIIPAMGLVSEVTSVHSRKPIFGYRAMVYSILAIMVLSFLVWGHHMFVTGMNPFVGSIFVFFTLLIAVPSAVKVFNWIGTLWNGSVRLNPPMLFAIGFVSLFISGGLTGLFLGISTIDIQMHDTYFVVAHFHIVMGMAAFYGMFAGIYHWYPKMFGRYMNKTLGYIHFWGTFIGSYCIFWPMHYMGIAGVPRRYYSFDNFDFSSQFGDLNAFITIAAGLVFLLQIIFVVNFFYSMFKGRKVTEKNPWGATTLEWTTPINPGHGNWPGEIPEVHRWAYDYSKEGKNGEDFIAQTEPLTEAEKNNPGHH